MIKLIKHGKYRLIEAKKQTKILMLDGGMNYVLGPIKNAVRILVASYKSHKTDIILSEGSYRLYRVRNESNFTDQVHLELLVGRNKWQGYLLPTNLPNKNKRKKRIIPTKEIISQTIEE